MHRLGCNTVCPTRLSPSPQPSPQGEGEPPLRLRDLEAPRMVPDRTTSLPLLGERVGVRGTGARNRQYRNLKMRVKYSSLGAAPSLPVSHLENLFSLLFSRSFQDLAEIAFDRFNFDAGVGALARQLPRQGESEFSFRFRGMDGVAVSDGGWCWRRRFE